MTGFGGAEKDGYRVEVRSINHRFLEINVRTPSSLNRLEIPFRNLVKGQFARGKFDISVTVLEQGTAELNINTAFVKDIYGAFKKLQEDLAVTGEIDINTLVNLHGMFIATSPKYDIDSVTGTFQQALKDLHAMRLREGETLSQEMRRMTGELSGMNGQIRNLSGRVLSEIKEKFLERLKTVLEGMEVDQNRILQEAAIMAAKLDIAEELTRIESHLQQFRKTLEEGGSIGRKLDFILQELNREVNTIGSKSSDYDISSLTVAMKTEIEKIREQVQNIQ